MSEAAAVLPDVGTVSQFENLNLIYRRDMIWRCWRWLLIISRSVYKIVPGWRSSAPHRRRVCLCQWPAVQITQDTLSGAFLSLLRSQYGGGRLRNVWMEEEVQTFRYKGGLVSSPVCGHQTFWYLISPPATRTPGSEMLELVTYLWTPPLIPSYWELAGSAAKITVARGLCVGRVFLCPGLVCAAWLWPRLECDCVATKPGTWSQYYFYIIIPLLLLLSYNFPAVSWLGPGQPWSQHHNETPAPTTPWSSLRK